MTAPDWIWYLFAFAFGCCVGSFLNVVIYRMPKDLSLVRPPSACPACGAFIRFYDNIPLLSWIALGAKCRRCKAAISPRYFVVELLTGLTFAGLGYLLFRSGWRQPVEPFLSGGWLVWLLYALMASALIAASAIDLELKVIPLSVCWFATAVALAGAAAGPLLIKPEKIAESGLLPTASPASASLAVGAAAGLGLSWLMVACGLLKRSYDESTGSKNFDDRREICRESAFLAPIAALALAALWATRLPAIRDPWEDLTRLPPVAGFLGALWGYFAGCAAVWFTRVAGTLAFGKEAMGLGDVHLMGAAGALIGARSVVIAFFIAPFFGLVWAIAVLIFRKKRQIPYGPFLSAGVGAVIIAHDFVSCYLFFCLKS
jgi:leader peptidase (prepilin peptidase)/N-methyltransferase